MSQTDSTKTETETEQEKETQKLAIKSSFLFDFETEIKSISLKRDELKDFLLLTQNQLEVNDKKRETRIKEKEKQFPKSLFNFHQECEKVFLNDWKIFKFKNRIYQDQHEIKQEIETPEAQKFEIDYEESQTQDNFTKLMNYSFESEKDEQKEDLSNEVIEDEDLNFSLLKIPNRDKALIANKTEREKNMKNLFNVYSQKDITQYIGDPRIPFKPFINSPEYQIFVEFVDLSLNFKEQLEPFYFSLALFDLRRKTRISENFYFQFNEEKFSFLPSNQKDSGISLVTQSKRAVFNISEPSKDIFLLLTISTIFQGDHEAKADIYSKPVPTKQKLYDKLKSQITDSCKKFSQFKQDFTWAMFPLFSFDRRTKQLCETFLSNKIQQFSPLYRIKDFTSEEQFFKFLGEQKATMKKQSSIPGFCSFKIARINEQNRKELFGNSTIFDPSMRVVEDNQDTKTAVLEMEDFALSAKRAVNYCFVNNLYIYPKFLTISSIKGSSIQNIEIKIQLKEDDKDIQSPGLPVFYGRILEKKFVDFRYVNIQYKTRKPHFNDEIKIALPLNLTHKHHLLFTFYNLNHKDKKQQGKELFGHAVVPIFQPDFLIEGKFQVPVCMALSSSGYLSSSELVMQEKQKNYFELESKIISSVYPQDKDVMGFLKSIEMLSRNGKEDLVQSMQVLRKHSANFHDILIQFLPVLFNVLLDIMTNKQQDDPLLREEAFHTFAQLSFEVIQIREALEVDVLQNYVDYVFNNFDNGKREIFQELVGQWNKALEHDLSQVSDPQNIQSEGNAFVNPTRFFFDLIIKSMVLYLDFNGKLNSNQRLDLFGIDFLDGMRNLVRNLNKEVVVRFIKGLNVAKRLNQAIALFLKDLIDICDVSFVFEIVESYIEALQTQDVNIQILSYEFINLFVEHENYVQFNIPVMPTYTSSTNLVEFLSQRHLLSGIIIQSVFKTLEMKDVNNKIRSIAITTLQNLLHKHDIDPRFQTPQIKSRIAIIYHLFVLFMIDKMDVYKDFPRELRRDLLISFLYILKMIDKHYFIQWWCFEGISRRIDFFQLLELCIDSFDYLGKKKA
ncbi:dedicator of cytokinesis dock [Anaeramoeba ignava]|uniref:Dedicator of cytokinesis dock n=1 Tax=Anaeramoeba ignava TaxID=1746090 RepID=A0A9Q0LB65_ANAIG|nr:dedicator of cytokinesis dock [Anaeramoeba ignava]